MKSFWRVAVLSLSVERLFRLTVHRVDEFHASHAEVIGRLDFDEHFLDVGRPDVATGLPDRDGRRHVVERVDDVFDRAGDLRPVFGGQLDAIEAVLTDDQFADERRVVCRASW